VAVLDLLDFLEILGAVHCFLNLAHRPFLLLLELLQAILHQSKLEFNFLVLEVGGKHLHALVPLAFNELFVKHGPHVDFVKLEGSVLASFHHWGQFQMTQTRGHGLDTSPRRRGFPSRSQRIMMILSRQSGCWGSINGSRCLSDNPS
jgi:hypothetical protein